jgi:hypothetical protein
MPQSAFGLIEMIFSFGVVLALLIWELVRTRRALKADRERSAREKAGRN